MSEARSNRQSALAIESKEPNTPHVMTPLALPSPRGSAALTPGSCRPDRVIIQVDDVPRPGPVRGRRSALVLSRGWRECLHPQPRPKPFPMPGDISGWGSCVASARCQAHALDRCSNGELIGALRRAGGGRAANEAFCSVFSIANIFRCWRRRKSTALRTIRSRRAISRFKGNPYPGLRLYQLHTLADLTCPKLPLTRYYPWEVIFTREAS